MPGVDEIRAGIALANEKASASIAALEQAAQSLQEAQQSLAQATAGSTQEEISQAHGLLAEALPRVIVNLLALRVGPGVTRLRFGPHLRVQNRREITQPALTDQCPRCDRGCAIVRQRPRRIRSSRRA